MNKKEQEERLEGIYVTKEDINNIGHTIFKDPDTGCLSIICGGETVNIEKMFLRSILKCFGSEYAITGEEDYIWEDINGNEVYDILFKTNLPKELWFGTVFEVV